MSAKQASVGDALIFITKAILASIVLIAMLAAGIWGYTEWSDGKSTRVERALRNAAAAHADAENRVVIFAYQNRYLKEYVVSLEQALREGGGELPPLPTERLSDEEVLVVPPCLTKNPCKPWERWASPDPPVNPFEAESRRRGISSPPSGYVIDQPRQPRNLLNDEEFLRPPPAEQAGAPQTGR